MVIISITVEPGQLKLPWERKTVQDNGEFVLVDSKYLKLGKII